MKLAPPFSERERFRLSRHKEILRRTLVFIRHQMALVSCFSAARSRFSCREGGGTQPAVTMRIFSGLLHLLTHPCAEQVARNEPRMVRSRRSNRG